MIKKETGRSAQEYVQQKIIDTAKDLLADPGKTISEIAYALGYQYPQYFSRAFKKAVGCTPQRIQNVSVGCFHCCTESTKTLMRRCSYRCLF